MNNKIGCKLKLKQMRGETISSINYQKRSKQMHFQYKFDVNLSLICF